MGLISWIILGLISGFIASRIVKTGTGLATDFALAPVLGIVGAIIGGFLASFVGIGGVTGINIGSIIISVIGAVVALWVYRASRATVAASYNRLRLGRGSDEPVYVPNPLGAPTGGETLDRSGRPLPWRWERSLSRDLLGPYGLAVIGAAVAVEALTLTSVLPSSSATPILPLPPSESSAQPQAHPYEPK